MLNLSYSQLLYMILVRAREYNTLYFTVAYISVFSFNLDSMATEETEVGRPTCL